MEKQYTTLAILWATEVLKGNKTVEAVKIESLRLQVEGILADKDLLVSIFATRVMEGMETMETVPVGIRTEVEDFLGNAKGGFSGGVNKNKPLAGRQG